jgi:hypothetical protein
MVVLLAMINVVNARTTTKRLVCLAIPFSIEHSQPALAFVAPLTWKKKTATSVTPATILALLALVFWKTNALPVQGTDYSMRMPRRVTVIVGIMMSEKELASLVL